MRERKSERGENRCILLLFTQLIMEYAFCCLDIGYSFNWARFPSVNFWKEDVVVCGWVMYGDFHVIRLQIDIHRLRSKWIKEIKRNPIMELNIQFGFWNLYHSDSMWIRLGLTQIQTHTRRQCVESSDIEKKSIAPWRLLWFCFFLRQAHSTQRNAIECYCVCYVRSRCSFKNIRKSISFSGLTVYEFKIFIRFYENCLSIAYDRCIIYFQWICLSLTFSFSFPFDLKGRLGGYFEWIASVFFSRQMKMFRQRLDCECSSMTERQSPSPHTTWLWIKYHMRNTASNGVCDMWQISYY